MSNLPVAYRRETDHTRSTCADRRRRVVTCFAAFIVLAMIAVSVLAPQRIQAHTELERTSPEENAVLAAPPQTVQFWTTEAVATGAGSPSVGVLDEDGTALTVSEVQVDPNDSRHVTASVAGIGFGTFTVVWSFRSEVDGHTLNGTYAFRVGGTSRAPGAATVEGETPRIWAVVTRWITFLGAAIAAAGFLIGPLVLRQAGDGDTRRRFALVAGAAAAGLIATLAEPILQTIFPSSGLASPSFSDAIGGLPNAWFLRAPGLLVAALIGCWFWRRGQSSGSGAWLGYIGAAAALIAILGLALTSHASARDSWRALAIASVIIHQWSVALWSGGLVQLLFARPFERGADQPMPIQRFSRYALVLALAGIATGVLNAGLVLPALRSLWESDYGKVLIAKIVILVPALALATYHRLTLRRALDRAASAFRVTLRVETALVVLVVLGGSTLALLAPPSEAKSDVGSVDLAAPFSNAVTTADRYARFVLEPADQGQNEITVSVTEGPPRYLNEETVFVDAPPLTDIALARVSLVNLDYSTAPIDVELTADGAGTFHADGIQLGLDGWWRADVLIRQLGVEDVTVPFYFILPDPNVHGESAAPSPDSQPDAEFLFDRGLTGYTSLHSVHFVERLAGGNGAVVVSDHTVHDGTTGQPAALQIKSSSAEVIRMEGSQWVRQDGGEWTRTDASAIVPPSEWGTDFAGATGFRLGGTEQIGDRAAQIVTFYVPSDRFATAWYAWWVDLETGRLLRETMVSSGHYMVRNFDQFDSVPPVVPPVE